MCMEQDFNIRQVDSVNKKIEIMLRKSFFFLKNYFLLGFFRLVQEDSNVSIMRDISVF